MALETPKASVLVVSNPPPQVYLGSSTPQKPLEQTHTLIPHTLIDGALDYLSSRPTNDQPDQSLYRRPPAYSGIDSLLISPVDRVISESNVMAAHLSLQRRWRVEVASSISKAVSEKFTLSRQSDIVWKKRLIAEAVQDFWQVTAREQLWPAAVRDFRASFIETVAEPAMSRTPNNKRLRSPLAPKRGEKRRKKSATAIPPTTTEPPPGKTITVGISCLAFGTLKSPLCCPAQQTSSEELGTYACRFLRSLIETVVPLGDAEAVRNQPRCKPIPSRRLARPPARLMGPSAIAITVMGTGSSGTAFEPLLSSSRWKMTDTESAVLPAPVPKSSIVEIFQPSKDGPVMIDEVAHLRESECQVEKLSRPMTYTSQMSIVQGWSESDARTLLAALMMLAPQFFTAFRTLTKLLKISKTPNITLSEAERQALVTYITEQPRHRTLEEETIANLDECLPISCAAIQEFVSHTLLKTGQPEEWIRRQKASPIGSLSAELLHFLARRKLKDKRRGRDRRNPFVLEQALLTTPAVETRRNSVQQQAAKLKTVADALPPWAVIYRSTEDVWESAVPMLSVFNLVGGSMIAPGKQSEFMKRFLNPEAVPRPIIFSRLVRSLQSSEPSVPDSGVLASRIAKYKLSNPSPQDLPVLASEQLCMPVYVSIKASQRIVRKLAIAWDPSEEVHLWEAVTNSINLPTENTFRDFLKRVRREVAEAVVSTRTLEQESFLRLVDWQLVAFWLNTCLSPFDRARSSNECRAKFVSLLLEYAAGMFEFVTVKPPSVEIPIEEDPKQPSPPQKSLVIPSTTITPDLLSSLDLPEDFLPSRNVPTTTFMVQTGHQKQQQQQQRNDPPDDVSILDKIDQVKMPNIHEMSLEVKPIETQTPDVNLQELMDNLKKIDLKETGREVGGVREGLEWTASFLQASKMRTHFETQGLLSASTWSNLVPKPAVSGEMQDAANYRRWSRFLMTGTTVNQLQRMAKALAGSHDFTEKRRRSVQGALQESFVADRPLRLHIQSSQGCLPVLQALRDRLKLRQPGQDVPSQTVYSAALRSYHRLILPPHESQIAASTQGLVLGKSLSKKEGELESPIAALMIISRALHTEIKNSSKKSAGALLALLEDEIPKPPVQTRTLDMTKMKFPTLRLIPTAVVRAQQKPPPEEAPRRPFAWRSPEITQKRPSGSRGSSSRARRGMSPRQSSVTPREQWPPPVDFARPTPPPYTTFLPPQCWPPRPFGGYAPPPDQRQWAQAYMQKSPGFPLTAYTAQPYPSRPPYYRPPEDSSSQQFPNVWRQP